MSLSRDRCFWNGFKKNVFLFSIIGEFVRRKYSSFTSRKQGNAPIQVNVWNSLQCHIFFNEWLCLCLIVRVWMRITLTVEVIGGWYYRSAHHFETVTIFWPFYCKKNLLHLMYWTDIAVHLKRKNVNHTQCSDCKRVNLREQWRYFVAVNSWKCVKCFTFFSHQSDKTDWIELAC